MTPFEFVFALISIITSLAVTQIITGVVAIIRNADRSSFSLTHALWIWIAFAVVLGNWGTLWSARLDADWPALRVLAWLTSMTSLYAFCALVIPDMTGGGALNLRQFHEREGRRYIIAHNVFAALAVALVLAIGSAPVQSAENVAAPVVAFALGMAALLTRGRLQLIASILVAALATLFMLANVSALTA